MLTVVVCSLYKLIFFFTHLCYVVYSGAGMEEGDEIYVDLRDEDDAPDPNAPMMAMLRRLQQELAEIKGQNDRLSLASEEQENLIRELNLRNSQEGEVSGMSKKGKFSNDSKEYDTTRHQYK